MIDAQRTSLYIAHYLIVDLAAHRNAWFEPEYAEIASIFFPFRPLEDLNCQQNFILMIAGCLDVENTPDSLWTDLILQLSLPSL